MFWMQNLVIVVISYLISRIIIEEEIHTYLISQLLNKAKKNPEFIVSGILFLSYFFSIFLSNTVVIISFIPIIKAMLDSIEDARKKSLITTNLVLAMIYGANIGGMASLTGSAFNVLYIGFLEINNIPGRENINFFSWFVFGVPLTLVLLLLSKAVLHLGSRNIPFDEVIYANHIKKKPKNFGKQMTFATINIVFMFL
ncbi:MAG: anion permease, partial [Acidobacteria bacterium]|nr:anion permease [Acidobacteriota bacterium]